MLLLGWLPRGDGQLSPLAHHYGRRFRGLPFLHGPRFPGYCCFLMAGAASSRYTGRVCVHRPGLAGRVSGGGGWGWDGVGVSCGLQAPPEGMGPALHSSSRKAAPSGRGWGSPQVTAGDTGRLQLLRNRLLSPQTSAPLNPHLASHFPESLFLGPLTKPFHLWSQVRSTTPSTPQHKVLILG